MSSVKSAVSGFLGMAKTSDENPQEKATYSVLNLHTSQNSGDLITAHTNVWMWWLPYMSQKEGFYDFMRPETMWTEEEKAALHRKKKPVIAFGRLKSSERAFIGNLIMQKYAIKAAPLEPSDQNLSDVVEVLHTTTTHDNSCRIKDVGMIRDAWCGGDAWQESYVVMGPGRKPRIVVENQNNFAIYPDPNRRDLVNNSDCQFIDRVSWRSMDELITVYPELEEEIREAFTAPSSITYQPNKPWADRQHEYMRQKNGRVAVVERQYRVWKRRYDAVNLKDGTKAVVGYDMDKEARDKYAAANPGHKLCVEPQEFLYLAVAAYGMDRYLFNGPYHAQPINPKTGRIMFTLIELVDEDVGGFPTGHMEHMIGQQKAINAMAVNTLAQAKAASGVSHVVDPEFFDDDTLSDMSKNLSDGPRTFLKKRNAPKGARGIELVPQGELGGDTSRALKFAEDVLQDNSSTPAAMKGYSEGNVPAQLNDQRLQQASAQSMVAVTNYQNFLTQRALLWMCYWAEFWDFEEVIRVVQKSDPKGPDYIVVNQLVADAWGRPQRLNNLRNLFKYDLVFEESWQSPSMRDNTRAQIGKMLNSSAVASDPVLNAFLQYYFILLTDAPQDLKDKILEHSQVLQKAEADKTARENESMNVDHGLKLQQLADREAEATTPRPASAGFRGRPEPSRMAA